MSTINGVDLDALNDTIEAVTNQRDLGRVTFSVDGAWEGGFRLATATGSLVQAGQADDSRAGRFDMSSDEPVALLGSDTAASPGEYVLQALAGCYTVTLAANAAARGITLDGYRLHLEADFDLAGFLGVDKDQSPGAQQIRVDVELDAPNATREQLDELIKVVESRSPHPRHADAPDRGHHHAGLTGPYTRGARTDCTQKSSPSGAPFDQAVEALRAVVRTPRAPDHLPRALRPHRDRGRKVLRSTPSRICIFAMSATTL